MTDLKILYLFRNDFNRFMCAKIYWHMELAKQTNMMHWGWEWHPDYEPHYQNLLKTEDNFATLIDKLDWRAMRKRQSKPIKPLDIREPLKTFKPDVILIAALYGWIGLKESKVPKAIVYGDPHGKPNEWRRLINKYGVSMIFHCSMDKFTERFILAEDRYPNCKKVLMPFCAPTCLFKDYGFDREYDICILGRSGMSLRPVRTGMLKQLGFPDNITKEFKIFYKPRPRQSWGYHKKYRERPDVDVVILEDYAKAIANSKIFGTCGSAYKYPVAKYFEVLGCNTLLFADAPRHPEMFHLIPDYNFVQVEVEDLRENKFLDMLRYYLENEDERKKIAKRGYETFLKYHTCEVRAKQYIKALESLL